MDGHSFGKDIGRMLGCLLLLIGNLLLMVLGLAGLVIYLWRQGP